MNQSDRATEQPSSEKISQLREESINQLVRLYFYSVILVVLAATIQIWLPARLGISGVQKDILGPLIAAIGVTFSYSFIKDTISAKFDADTERIESEAEKKSLEKNRKILENNQKILEKIDESTIKYNSDFKYLAYIKPIIDCKKLPLSGVSSKFTTERGENFSAFEKRLDEGLKSNRNSREVRYKIYSLTDEFLGKLALIGIQLALGLEKEAVNEKTEYGGKFHFLLSDVYAYLSAWLICSIDNDMGDLMPIACIGMRYTTGDNVSDKETYKKVIKAIKKIIVDGLYTDIECYEDTDDPLSSDCVKHTIVDCLDKLIYLIEEHTV
jgi:hypothetical protein